MLPIVPWTVSAFAVGVVLVLVMVSTRAIQPAWWRSRAVRGAIFVALTGMIVGLAMWRIGATAGDHGKALLGCGIAYVGLLVVGPAATLMPFGAAIDRGLTKALVKKDAPEKAGLGRRALIRAGGSALPALGAAAGIDGFVTAKLRPRMPIVRFAFEDLHPDLHGLKILHLSDVHLGGSISLADLEAGLDAAFLIATDRPDLVVLTGDLADDPALIAPAMERIARVAARYGAFASLGNHEYLHDIRVTRPHFEASRVPLLVSSGRTISIGRARLFVGGADDPVHMDGPIAKMLRPSIERAASLAPRDADFRLLLCHRPEGLGPAADNGFDLVLSGHTHGGQVGLFGRSLLEKFRPGIGWWGRYEQARPAHARGGGKPTRLYTTSGFGHWFPFRVGCPTEMPLVVLERATSRDRGTARV